MNEAFKSIVDTPSLIVDAIVEKAMSHAHKGEAQRFLTFMDNYICYYLHRECNEICFPIIRIPSCPIWARELFLNYLIYRLSIYYNRDSLKDLSPSHNLHMRYVDPFDRMSAREARKHNKYLPKWNSFKRTIKDLNETHEYIGKDGHKNLIFCSPKDLIVSRDSKDEFIEKFYGTPNDIFSPNNVCVCHDLTTKEIRYKIRESKTEICIDNIFVFFTNNDECKSLRKADIEKLNRSGNVGVKNCFVFDFTDHPYRLAETLRQDKKLSFIYPGLNEKEYQYNDFFTTLNDEETNYLFSKTLEKGGKSEHWHVKDNESLHETYFKPLIGYYTDNSEYWVQERNNFSLCLSDELINVYKQRLKRFTTDIDVHIYDESFEVQRDLIQKIKNELFARIKESGVWKLALVVDYYLPNEMRNELKSIFYPYQVKIYNYSNLHPQRNGKSYILGNKIDEKLCFVLRYRPHNAKSAFSNYPNSFDPFTTNPGQKVIEIIQDYIFIDKFLWDKYDYELEEYKHFNSVYRREMLGGLDRPIKPNVTRVSGDEDPNDEKKSARQNIATLEIVDENGYSSRIAESKRVIYRIDEEDMNIARLKDLKEDDLLDRVTAIQRLDEITDALSQAIIEKQREYTKQEKFTRQNYYERGVISEEERDSDVYLWKILLAKKIAKTPQRDVYNEIMQPLRESEKIQYSAFIRWVNPENSMILPLQKTMQKRLIEYLGLSPAYLYVMRSKKMSEKNKTRKNNTMLENFLASYLLSNIDEDDFEQFKDSEINEILQYNRIDDLDALIKLLNEKINLKPVKRITK